MSTIACVLLTVVACLFARATDQNKLLYQLKGIIMTASQDTVDAITAQLSKASGEITGKIAELEAAVAAGETPDFTALKAAAQALDDLVPDAEPEPEPGDDDDTGDGDE